MVILPHAAPAAVRYQFKKEVAPNCFLVRLSSCFCTSCAITKMNIASSASQKQHGDSSVPKVDAHSVTKRLQSELMTLMVQQLLCAMYIN
jgi:hypothetical protein